MRKEKCNCGIKNNQLISWMSYERENEKCIANSKTKEKSAWLLLGCSWGRALLEEGENPRAYMKVFMHLLKQVTAFQIYKINKNWYFSLFRC